MSQADASTRLVTRYRYDHAGDLVLTLFPEFDQDASNVEAVVLDERGLVWKSVRGGLGVQFRNLSANADIPELGTVQDSSGLSECLEHVDSSGLAVRITDGESRETDIEYDGFLRKVRLIDAEGNVSESTYDAESGLLRVTVTGRNGYGGQDLLLSEKVFRRDERGRVYERRTKLFAMQPGRVTPDGPLSPADGWITTRYGFDRKGRTTAWVDDNQHSGFQEYDGVDRLVRETDAIGNYTELQYDPSGNVVHVLEHELGGSSGTEEYESWSFYDELGSAAWCL